MAGGPRVCKDLAALVEAVAGRSEGRIATTIYGIPLRRRRGERTAHVSRSEEGVHPWIMLEALRPPKSSDGARHPDLHRVPGRLFLLWQKGFSAACPRGLKRLQRERSKICSAKARCLEESLLLIRGSTSVGMPAICHVCATGVRVANAGQEAIVPPPAQPT
jgi:hypothetical protein